jgi:outer membrane protein assembly factor BamB
MFRRFFPFFILQGILFLSPLVPAAEQPQWGQAWTRNMVSVEKNLPDHFDPATRENVRWIADLGSETHGTPTVAQGRVYIGTNNGNPRDPKQIGDRGVFMCFDEKSGKFLWQLVVPKLDEDKYFDWPNVGVSSPITADGGIAYTVTNRGEVVALDPKGLSDGNDGPFRNEGAHMTPHDQPQLEPGPMDADILWLFDLVKDAGTSEHDNAHSSILVRGDYLYLNSGTGVDNTHQGIRKPDAPSLVVLDKRTGRMVARDDEHIAPDIFHCTWSSPSMGTVNGKELIFFCGGNGVVYAFEPLNQKIPEGRIERLKSVWHFDFDPAAPKQDIHSYLRNRQEGPSNIYGMPVFHDGRLFVAGGGDVFWGKTEAWLKCIEPSGEGDITSNATIWSYGLNKHTLSTVAIADGLVYVTDSEGTVHCVDEANGRVVWTHAMNGQFWASPLVADGKVWLGTRKGQFCILAASREKKVLQTLELGSPVSATATAANGTVFIAAMKQLIAVAKP